MSDPRTLGRVSLRWDAAFCALAGSLTVMFAAPLGDHLGLAPWLTALVGFVVLAWATIVWGMARGGEWWGPTALVGGVNLLAAVILMAWAIGTSTAGGALLGLVAAQVFGFAALQTAAIIGGWNDRVG